jgi:DNA-binding CsgD family transcriptional regulator
MQSFLTKLSSIGLRKELSLEDKKRIVLSNKLFFIYSFLITPHILFYLILGIPLISMVAAYGVVSGIVCLYLNSKEFYTASRILFVLSISLPIFICSNLLGPQSGVQYACFAIMISSFVLFSDEEKRFRYAFLLLHTVTYFSLEIFGYDFLYRIEISSGVLESIRLFIIASLFLIVVFTMRSYHDVVHRCKLSLSWMKQYCAITDRETDIVTLLLEGKSNKDIAQELFVEEGTIKKHLQSIFKKFQVKSRAELIALLSK